MNKKSGKVTISLDEYYNLRKASEINMMLMGKITEFETRQTVFEKQLIEIKRELEKLKRAE